MRRLRRILVAFVASAAAWQGAGAPTRADHADFAELTDRDADLADVRLHIDEIATRLSAGVDVTTKGSLTILSPGSDAYRVGIADRLTNLWKGAGDLLRAVGFETPAEPPAVTILVVERKGFATDWAWSPSGKPVGLLREGDLGRPAEPPGVAPRVDGPAIRRDAVVAAAAARAWQKRAAAAAAARSGAAHFMARLAVFSSVKRDQVPPWIYEGLVSWAESRVAGDAAPSHFCRSFATPTPALLAQLLEVKTAESPVTARFLGRFVGALVDGRTDAPKRLTALVQAGTPFEKAVQDAFGVTADAVLAKACDGLKDASGDCDEKATIPCVACKGAGKFELSCPDCSGTGAIACPACRGVDGCPADCDNGFVKYVGGKKVKCRVCSGGKLKCQACAGAMRAPCKSCGGTGKGVWPCLACRGTGRIVCPETGGGANAVAGQPCPWCQDATRSSACPDCSGVAYLGCDACGGTTRRVCGECGGTGEIRMVYSDGSAASSSKCSDCDGRGYGRCDECKSGRLDCTRCGGKGRLKLAGIGLDPNAACPGCVGGKLAALESPRVRGVKHVADAEAAAAAEAEANKKMLERAIAFLLTCNKTSNSAFALRKFRAKGQEEVGALQKPTLFSNADVLWTLAVVGVDQNDARTKQAWDVLREQAKEIVDGTAEYAGTQAVSQAIRALAAGGEDPKGALLAGLVAKLVKGQHASGWWGGSLDEKEADDHLDSLMAAEALRVARAKGAKVPRTVWQKLSRAASTEFEGPKGIAGMKVGFMSASEVLEAMAVVVMAKEGSLGPKATSFDYTSMPAIKKGLAWLDRYFDVRTEPAFVKGGMYRRSSDAGYTAYLFSVERLAMLLNIEILAGDRWHATGASYLRTLQHKDGSFEETSRAHLNGPVRSTTSVVVFLARATPPVTDVDDGE